MAVGDARRGFQAQIELTRAELQCKDADVRKQMAEIAANLAALTNQLNKFKPASVADVLDSREQLSSIVDDRLNLQYSLIDFVSESVHEAHKIAQGNAEMLHNLLVGMENLGESVK